MNSRVVLRIVAILGLGVVAALLLRSMFASSAPEQRVAMTAVGVAAAPLSVGTLIRADDIGWREVAAPDVKKGEIAKDTPQAHKLAGAVVRRAIEDGAVITERDVVFPDAPGFLAAALQPGMRAVSVAIDDVSGNAGLTLPGDRVDLILTHQLSSADSLSGAPPKVASETVLADVRVIAVGQNLRAPDSEGAGTVAAPGSGARTVTLEVTPRDAESVAVVSRLGHLSLALRSLAVVRPSGEGGPGSPDPSSPVWGKDISQVVRMSAPAPVRASGGGPAAPPSVQVFRGSGSK